MPIYQLNPANKQVLQATPGLETYLLGSFNRTVAPTRMNIRSVASNGTTFTYGFQVLEGNYPTAGQLVSVSACITNAQFNVTNATIASVSALASPDVGIGTFTVTKAGSFFVTTVDYGYAIAPQVEIGELISSLSVGGQLFNSREVSLQDNTGPDNYFTGRATASFPNGLPGACVVSLQTCDEPNIDTNYITFGTVASVTGGVLAGGGITAGFSFTGIRAKCLRLQVSGLAAVGSSTIVGKVLV